MEDAAAPAEGPPGADAAAVAEAIRAETLAYQRQDFEAWAACFVQGDLTQDVLASGVAGLSVQRGWPAVAAHMKRVFDTGLAAPVVDFGQGDIRTDVCGDVAWATFDSWSRTGDGRQLRSFDIRILRRVGGDWKIVFNAFVERDLDGGGGTWVGIDGSGRLTWGDRTALRDHPILTVSAGRLRARRTDWDRALQDAIRQAGRRHGFFETHAAARRLGGQASYPVVLGPTGEGGVAVVHLRLCDCATYVRIGGEDEDLARRLDFARQVFGLSDGQTRLAREIAEGKGLRDAAQALGIRVTTVRTHLDRIYDKTGVRTRTALVRLLLSVG